LPSFPDLAALNAWLEARCVERWSEIHHGVLQGTITDAHAEEVPSLMPPGRPFDGFVEHAKRVSPTCLVSYDRMDISHSQVSSSPRSSAALVMV
jgi:hypothetical protein